MFLLNYLLEGYVHNDIVLLTLIRLSLTSQKTFVCLCATERKRNIKGMNELRKMQALEEIGYTFSSSAQFSRAI